MKKMIYLLLGLAFIYQNAYAINKEFTIENETGFTLAVKAVKEYAGCLWCDDHKNTFNNPCTIPPHSNKSFKGTTTDGRTLITYEISSIDPDNGYTCVNTLRGFRSYHEYAYKLNCGYHGSVSEAAHRFSVSE